jgi:hypothetical protein
MTRLSKIVVAVLLLTALSGCVAGSEAAHHAAGQGFIVQFVLGFWHGVIAPFSLICEVINVFAPHLIPWNIHLYESRGTGVAYDVGFYLGLVGSPVVIIHRRYYRRP